MNLRHIAIRKIAKLTVFWLASCLMVTGLSFNANASQSGDDEYFGIGENFNPSSPADPDGTPEHEWRVKSNPEDKAYIYNSSSKIKEGERFTASVFPHIGWRITSWVINGERINSSDNNLPLVMGSSPMDITANLAFDPSNPTDPSVNYFNRQTGEMIIDYFKPGELGTAIFDRLNDDYENSVISLIVKGVMNASDYYTLSSLSGTRIIDLSRTGGVNSLPSYALSNPVMESLILPADINYIDRYAFSSCDKLSSITLYSLVPPTCNDNAFTYFKKENVVVYVPTSSLGLYADDEQWKEFTLLPMNDNSYDLLVSLPEECKDGRYKNYSIELVNLKSNVKQKYLVTDRITYTFHGLLKEEKYVVYLLSQDGLEIGRISDIVIPDKDIEVAFDQLATLNTVTVRVIGKNGEDFTDDVTVEWLKPNFDGSTTYLKKAKSISEMPEGQELLCKVTLKENLGSIYHAPENILYTVVSGNNVCHCFLTPYKEIFITGTIKDSNNNFLGGASVAVSQHFNGNHIKTVTTNTDKNGHWELSIFDVPNTEINFSAINYLDESVEILYFEPNVTLLNVGDVMLKNLIGGRINFDYTFTGFDKSEENFNFIDTKNLFLSGYNISQDYQFQKVFFQNFVIILQDDKLKPGDEVKLILSSHNNSFSPVESTLTIDEKMEGNIMFNIIGKGGIESFIEMTDNTDVAAMLYNQNGELVQIGTYQDAKVTFENLNDGSYTLITMGKSDLINSTLRLSSFDSLNLREGSDYVRNDVVVKEGELTVINIPLVPFLDETQLYYTDSNTNFYANKNTLITGNYLTLKAQINFKEEFIKNVSNVSLDIDLPENSIMIEHSAIQGSNIIPYTLDNNHLSFELGNNYKDALRFCVMAISGGNFTSSAYVSFDLGKERIIQPIGIAMAEIKELELIVPPVLIEPTFIASGYCNPESKIELYDGYTLIGKGISNLNGLWQIEASLENSYNLSSHSLQAKIYTPSNQQLFSEAKEVNFDKYANIAKSVYMTFFNEWLNDNVEVTFDLIKKNVDVSSYMFYHTTDITFIADLLYNDPENVSKVEIDVYTTKGNWIKLPAQYDDKLDRWVAVESFNSNELPTGVKVEFISITPTVLDAQALIDNDNFYREEKEDYLAYAKENKEILEDLNNYLNENEVEDYDSQYLELLNLKLNPYLSEGVLNQEMIDMDDDEYLEYVQDLIKEMDKEVSNIDTDFEKAFENYGIEKVINSEFNGINVKIDISKPDNPDIESLIAEGYSKIETTEGIVLEKWDDNIYRRIDLILNSISTMTVDYTELLQLVNPISTRAIWDNVKQECYEMRGTLASLIASSKEGIRSLNALQNIITLEFDPEFQTLMKDDQILANELKTIDEKLKNASGFKQMDLKAQKKLIEIKRAAINSKLGAIVKGIEASSKIVGAAIGILTNCVEMLIDEYDKYDLVAALKVPSCLYEYNYSYAVELEEQIESLWQFLHNWYSWSIPRFIAYGILDLAIADTGIGSAITLGLVLGECKAEKFYSDYKKIDFNIRYTNLKWLISVYGRMCGDEDDDDPPYPKVTPIQDPSGYVYEAVPDNRVEGAQASIYYKETKEDMYGDLYDEEILWNAEDYAQENPLFTDENGMYRWDVPQGLWQVRFEKDGYESAQSEWLPVPPPQLDVNIAMTQNLQPSVIEAHAYETGVEIQFDKYMDLNTLTDANIYVTANNNKLQGAILFIDEQVADLYADAADENALRYASRVRFVPETKLSATSGAIILTVSRNVNSYAGLPMESTFSQELDIEKEVQEILASDVRVKYGDEKEVIVYGVPFEAAVGRKLNIKNSSNMIISFVADNPIFDEDGKVTLRVKGELPGTSQLQFSIDEVYAKGECRVNVVTDIFAPSAPMASRLSGTQVYRGTEITLSTDSETALIYYTLDGSCPCEENSRILYTGPIVINGDTRILAMAIDPEAEDGFSDTVEFNYYLKRSEMGYNLESGYNWISHNMESSVAAIDMMNQHNSIKSILSQTSEVVRDPKLGIVGTLQELHSNNAYKMEVETPDVYISLSDVARHPAIPIELVAGYNWISYPLDQTMTLDEALATTDAVYEEMVIGRDGTATFDGEKWIGSLKTLNPGKGYLYLSKDYKDLIYNTGLISKANAYYAVAKLRNSSWMADRTKYASVMPMIADILRPDGSIAEEGEYEVAAFCGSECRGVGIYDNGYVFMNVYGKAGDEISFRLLAAGMEDPIELSTIEKFSEIPLGSVSSPYEFRSGEAGVKSIRTDSDVKILIKDQNLYVFGDNVEYVGIYDLTGAKVLMRNKVDDSPISLIGFEPGIYVVSVENNNEWTYHKIMIK